MIDIWWWLRISIDVFIIALVIGYFVRRARD